MILLLLKYMMSVNFIQLKFHYQKNKLNALFSCAYVYLHGHEVGGTNPSLLNAMHMSAAPVAMDVIFHRQVMTDDGIYFTKDKNHLSSIIRQLDEDESKVKQLKKLAKNRSDSLYRWDAVVDAYVKLINIVKENYKNKKDLGESLKSEVYLPLDFYNKSNE